jgi:Carboxypeptidase regulatory-like domain
MRTVGLGLLVLAVACGKGDNKSSGTPAAAPAAASAGALGTAIITGSVKFVGKAPANPAIDMSEEPKCRADYTSQPHERVVVVNPNGTLADVFVYVKSGLPTGATYPPPTTPVVIDQKGCMYHPRVFGIMVGQQLEIDNSDSLLHNIKAMGKQNRPFNISQPAAGMKTDRVFTAVETMLPFECNVHGWMHAYAGVLPHPFFSTTGSDGTFTIKDLPAGTYTLEAWHAVYGAATATVTVHDGETSTVSFTYTAK